MCLIYIYIYYNNDGEGVRLIAVLIIIIILIAVWFFAMGMPAWLGIIFAIVIVFSIPFFISKKENDEKKKKKEEADAIKSTDEYQICVSKYDELLKKYKESKYYFNDMDGTNYAIFDNNIHIISALNDEYFVNIVKNHSSDLNERIYDIDKIRYYNLEGSVYQQQNISGGGGGGSSVKGAVVGGLIAGDAGAIIGSRKKTDDIKTTYEEKDDRHVTVIFTDDSELRLPYKFYDRLLDYIPEKDYENYLAAKREKGRKSDAE